MKTRPSRITSPSGKVLAGQLLLLLFVLSSAPALMRESGNPSAKPADLQKPTSAPRVVTANGLQTVAFDRLNGRVIVNLPDDMMAGDTISGTVVAAPKGQTEEERTQNAAELSKLKALISLKPLAKNTGKPEAVEPEIGFRFQELTPIDCCLPAHTSRIIERFNFSLPQSSGNQTYPLYLTLGQPNAPLTEVETVLITVSRPIWFVNDQARPAAPSRPTSTTSPNNFFLPVLGQQGRPIVIFGPFDGNSSNTTLNSAGLRSTVQDFEKNTENVSGGFGLLVESPRKAVFSNPQNVVGPIQITLKEGNKQTTGSYRNVGVNLSAPKTNLLKGETTTLTVEVTGLQGITEPVPLHLVKGGVVTMQGGDVQSMTIKPAEVQGNGTFSTTRNITGVQTGVWNATATIVVFDACLQDDNSRDLVVYSSVTGDFIFCQGRAAPAGANPISLSTLKFGEADFASGVQVSAGDVNDSVGSATGPVSIGPGASITRSGLLTVADFNYELGHIHVQINSYNHTGNASGFVYQQITIPDNQPAKKINFTITDRDTRNNTCACR